MQNTRKNGLLDYNHYAGFATTETIDFKNVTVAYDTQSGTVALPRNTACTFANTLAMDKCKILQGGSAQAGRNMAFGVQTGHHVEL